MLPEQLTLAPPSASSREGSNAAASVPRTLLKQRQREIDSDGAEKERNLRDLVADSGKLAGSEDNKVLLPNPAKNGRKTV